MTDLEARVAKLEEVVVALRDALRCVMEYEPPAGEAVAGTFKLGGFDDAGKTGAADVDRPNQVEG